MANGRQIAEANVRKLRAWADEIRRPEDWAAFITNGQLNRSAIASACGFGRSVFAQNPAAKALFFELEGRLHQTGVLEPRVERDRGATDASVRAQHHPAAADDKTRRLEQEIKRRDERIAAQMAEITGLRDRLRRLEHIEQIMLSGRRVIV
ncbi:conserved hypothetical protein [Hyphomicrobiales bacterium]|nr:conserved hypothetical protein [Hyphomicrobiales bacterium]